MLALCSRRSIMPASRFSDLSFRTDARALMDFVAIDFETATRRPDSPCQLAAVVVRDWQIIDQHCWLIRPRPLCFDPGNIAIHGITESDVTDAPEFDQVWKLGHELIANDVIIAHNARFDLNVLRSTLQSFRLPVPDMTYSCTRLVAMRTWPGRSRYGLKPTAASLGIEFRHHDALEDAIACAKIMMAAGRASEVQDILDLERRLQIQRGRAAFWGLDGPRGVGGTRRSLFGTQSASQSPFGRSRSSRTSRDADQITTVPMAPRLAAAAENPCWQGKSIVFTGRLKRVSRRDAERIAKALGGQLRNSVTKNTDVLVIGEVDDRTRAAGRQISTKQEKAEQLRCDGAEIEFVDESQFLALTGHTAAAPPADLFAAAARRSDC